MTGFWTASLVNALLQGCLAAVLCLTSNRLPLYNLAAGWWLLIGGWSAVAAGQLIGSMPILTHPWALLLLAGPALLQILSPLFLGYRRLRTPSAYLLVSFGIAFLVNGLCLEFFLRSSGSTIPFAPHLTIPLVVIVSLFLCVGWILRSRYWAIAATSLLQPHLGRPGLVRLCVLVAFELIMLLLLGAGTCVIHKGVIGSAEYRTVVALLAVLATRSNAVKSALLSCGAVLFPDLAVAYLGVPSAATEVVAVTFIIGAVLFFRFPPNALLQARRSDVAMRRVSTEQSIGKHLFRETALMSALLCLASLLLVLTNKSATLGVQTALWLVVLVCAALVGEVFMGVRTLCWPIIGLVSVYAAILMESPFLFGISIAIFFIILLGYFALLRVVNAEVALVIDLGTFVAVYGMLVNSEIPGVNSVQLFSALWIRLDHPMLLIAGQLALAISMIVVCGWANVQGRLRTRLLGLKDIRLGLQHDLKTVQTFAIASFAVSTVVILSTMLYHVASPTVTPLEGSLQRGMLVLLLGRVAASGRVNASLITAFGLFAVIEVRMAGSGNYLEMMVGIVLVVLSLALSDGGFLNARASAT